MVLAQSRMLDISDLKEVFLTEEAREKSWTLAYSEIPAHSSANPRVLLNHWHEGIEYPDGGDFPF